VEKPEKETDITCSDILNGVIGEDKIFPVLIYSEHNKDAWGIRGIAPHINFGTRWR
jgi:hypothetical protein